MALLLATSLWIAFTRARTPMALKQLIAAYVLDPAAHLAEPVMFELLRFATPAEHRQLEAQFATLPVLDTPASLWHQAALLGQACRACGATVLSLDLLIAALALHHQAELVTFDRDFALIAQSSDLQVKLLRRPGTDDGSEP
jgi:predicted nucleic acid-binding protein